jgi:SH3 domain protein
MFYVKDKLLMGIHEDKRLDSAIIKTLPSGAAVEMVKQESGLAYIKEAGGGAGWVDDEYLVKTPPAIVRVVALEKEKAELAERLKKAEAVMAKLEERVISGGSGAKPAALEPTTAPSPTAAPPTGTETVALKRENEELGLRLASERARAGELQAKLATSSGTASGADPALTRQLKNAMDEAQQLKEELGDLQKRGGGAATIPAGYWEALGQMMTERHFLTMFLIALALMTGAGFFGGIFFMDYVNRSAHGGYRV